MMKHEGQTQYRFYRPRRPGGMGEGLKLEGMSAWFGLLGIALLMMVGIAMLLVSNVPGKDDLQQVTVELQAPPYYTAKFGHSILLPLTGARVMTLDPATYAASDTLQLFSFQKGTVLKVWLLKKDASDWNNGVSRKEFYTAILLQKNEGDWLVDYPSYRKKAMRFNSKGWWLILFGLLLIPYQLIKHPRVPFWLALLLFSAAILTWTYLL